MKDFKKSKSIVNYFTDKLKYDILYSDHQLEEYHLLSRMEIYKSK